MTWVAKSLEGCSRIAIGCRQRMDTEPGRFWASGVPYRVEPCLSHQDVIKSGGHLVFFLNPRRGEEIFASYIEKSVAIDEDLPIGSGVIESGNRHVSQDRLKRPGAWWAEGKIQPMLNLRTLRANGGWDDYWLALSVAA